MPLYNPGETIATKTLKNGSLIKICYPKWQDLDSLLEYVNAISAEDTFSDLSGEVFSKYEESQFLAGKFIEMENENGVTLFAFVDQKIVGICGVSRNNQHRSRGYHRANLGLSIAKEYRNLGIGKILLQETIENAKKNIIGLKLIELEVVKINQTALNLYSKLGFKIVGEISGACFYKGNYEDVIIMTLSI